MLESIAAAAGSDNYPWLHDFSHGPADFQYLTDLFNAINDRYGKDGNDTVWFASVDEIYEYNYFRNNYMVEKSVSDNVLTLKFSCPVTELPNEMQFYRDFSIMLYGVNIADNVEIESGSNIFGLSFAKLANDSFLVNADCNKSLLDKAERYTALHEKAQNSLAKEDALYFVNRLKEELKHPFEVRINNLHCK